LFSLRLNIAIARPRSKRSGKFIGGVVARGKKGSREIHLRPIRSAKPPQLYQLPKVFSAMGSLIIPPTPL
jgi:hypothetical protein